jgi:hypothetical protein
MVHSAVMTHVIDDSTRAALCAVALHSFASIHFENSRESILETKVVIAGA